MNKVIVITYDGKAPSETVVKALKNAIDKCTSDKDCEITINVIEDSTPETTVVRIDYDDMELSKKTTLVKNLANLLGLTSESVYEMVGNRTIIVPADKNVHDVLMFINNQEIPFVIPHADKNAVEMASIFLNRFRGDYWKLVSEVATARNASKRSKEQEALLNAVDIIAEHSFSECEKYGIDNILHNLCYNVKYRLLD